MSNCCAIAKVAVASAVYAIDKPFDYLVPDNAGVAVGARVIVPFGRGNRKTEGFVVALTQGERTPRLKAISHIFRDKVWLSREDIALATWMTQRYFCTFFEAAGAMMPPGVWNKGSEVYAPGDMSLKEALSAAGAGPKARAVVNTLYVGQKPMTEAQLAEALGHEVRSVLARLTADGLVTETITFERKVGDRMIWMLSLALPLEQALQQAGTGELAQKRRRVIETVAQAGVMPEKEACYLTGASDSVVKRLAKIGILYREKQEVFRAPDISNIPPAQEIVLNEQQREAFDGLTRLMDGQARAALLNGVTGSGKTLVYIKLIRKAVEQGRGAIFLVPEIALTPQMVRQFYAHFPGQVAVVHSGLTHAQRYDEYKRIRIGQAKIVVGTRTGVLAPVENLGVIIIDEEQEYTYKADNPPRYHARDVAKYRAVRSGALLVLGSATPSVESYYYAAQGRYTLLTMPQRYGSTPLPQTVIADMRQTLKEGNDDQVGPRLLEELQANLDRGEQSILFLNRRGSAKMAICIDCGEAPQCVNCSVALTYHSRNGRLMCHHCGHSIQLPKACPSCGSEHMRLIGSGTQRIEEELRLRLPGAVSLRMDADTTHGRQSHESLLDQFAQGKADILIGTQMVSKGLDFDNVTLVGVLDADLSLFCGDYHSQERTFSLLAQVVGRAGRRQKPGRAVIQTFAPENPVILAAARQDYPDFFRYEIESRKAILAPPFCDIFVFTLSAIRENDALAASLALSGILARFFNSDFKDIKTQILGPVSAPIARLNKRYRFTVSIRGKDSKRFRELISKTLVIFAQSPTSRLAAVSADMNPV